MAKQGETTFYNSFGTLLMPIPRWLIKHVMNNTSIYDVIYDTAITAVI